MGKGADVKDEKKEAEAKKASELEEKRRAAAMSDYEKRLTAVRKTATLTDTMRWKELYRSMQDRIAAATEALQTDEKMDTVRQHQAEVKVLRQLISDVAAPVCELEAYVRDNPLFAPAFPHAATWDEKKGTVIITAGPGKPETPKEETKTEEKK